MATSTVPNNPVVAPGGPTNGSGNGFGPSGGGGSSRMLPAGTQMMGMWLGLASIGMLFVAMTSAYIVRQGLGSKWDAISMPPIMLLSTLILLVSSVTMEMARRHYRTAPGGAAFNRWLSVTMVLGLGFVAGQLVAWQTLLAEGIYMGISAHSSFFYILTAMHAVHLLGGVLALALLFVFVRGVPVPAFAGSGGYTRNRKTWVEVTSVYWHFMDGLWVYLLLLLFVIG